MRACTGLALVIMVVAVSAAPGQAPKDRKDNDPKRNFLPAQARLGDKAPGFHLEDLEGKSWSLQEVLGKRAIVIEFGSYT